MLNIITKMYSKTRKFISANVSLKTIASIFKIWEIFIMKNNQTYFLETKHDFNYSFSFMPTVFSWEPNFTNKPIIITKHQVHINDTKIPINFVGKLFYALFHNNIKRISTSYVSIFSLN